MAVERPAGQRFDRNPQGRAGRPGPDPLRAQARPTPARGAARLYREANPRLDFEPLWFDAPTRRAIADAFGRVASERRYTVWACAVCRNHGHLCARVHRDHGDEMWDHFARAARDAVRAIPGIDPEHPVWSQRPYVVFLNTPDEVVGRVDYIRKNPMKEGLPEQHWPFVQPYDGWPLYHKRARPRRR